MNPEAPIPPHSDVTQPINSQQAPPLMSPQPMQRTNGLATAALVFGIIGFMAILPLIGPVLAIIFGSIALHQIKQGKGTGRGLAHAGLWLGVAGVVFQLIILTVLIAVTYTGVQQKANLVSLRTQVARTQTYLEEYYAINGYYPAELSDMSDYSVPSSSSSTDRVSYQYDPVPSGCAGTKEAIAVNQDTPTCTGYTLKGTLDDGSEYSRSGGTEINSTLDSSDSEAQSGELLTN